MRTLLLPILYICALLPHPALAQNDVVKDAGASDFNRNKPERVEWFRQAGSGLFIHFGVDAQLGVVISHSLVGASDEYVQRYFSQLPKTFDPYRFNPRELAVLARLAGMKYVMFTTKHHSGFCLWDTKTTAFNCMNTPYHRDMVKEYVEAVRAEGLEVGFYFSPEDFHFLHEHHLPIQRGTIEMDAATRAEYDDYTRKQCEELMTNYGKIDLLFIDGEPKDVVKRTCWQLQPDLLITRGAMKTPEQVLPGATVTDPWLSCITMGTAWQYQPTNERYKTGTQLIGLAIEARAKGGSLLLNVGPKPNGELPAELEDRLREMAAWYFINHDCMDSVHAWTVSREGDIWFTADSSHTLYAIVTNCENWKEGQRRSLVLRSVRGTAATRVNVLGQNSRVIEYKNDDVGCRWRQTDSGLEVSVVKAQRIYDDHRWPNPVVIRLDHVEPVFTSVISVHTGNSALSGDKPVFTGRVDGPSKGRAGTGYFYYRPYAGQIETLYAAPWKRSRPVAIAADGSFRLVMTGADRWHSFEYRAVVSWYGVEINGEDKLYQPVPDPKLIE
ncbi:alpha-L-fucosidase [Puia sp. P3]|uniref:alpha-L-fucosidase n=1 Tax=Puia sp. P3 TaxID=3423952 RepID=UPI003D66649F